jgi:hypothetical protein
MGRDKSRDDKYFNCQQEHESYYVSKLYTNKEKIHQYLASKCNSGKINYSTHMEVYKMIQNDLGYPIPI